MPGTVTKKNAPDSPHGDRTSRHRIARRYGWEQPRRPVDTWLPKAAIVVSVVLLVAAAWLVLLAKPWGP